MAKIKLFYTKENKDYYPTFFFVSDNKKSLVDIWKIFNIHDIKSVPFIACEEDFPLTHRIINRELDIFKYGKYYLSVVFTCVDSLLVASDKVCQDIAIAIAYKNSTLVYKYLNHKIEKVSYFSYYLLNYEDDNEYDLTIHTIKHVQGKLNTYPKV